MRRLRGGRVINIGDWLALRHRDAGALARAAGSMLNLDWTSRILGMTPLPVPGWLDSYR